MRLTPEQAQRLDANAYAEIAAIPNIAEFFRGEPAPFLRCDTGNTHAWRCRVLDLLDEVAALRARAEQAERDCTTLAAEVQAWRNYNDTGDTETEEERRHGNYQLLWILRRLGGDGAIARLGQIVQRAVDASKATDSSGALSRAGGGA